MKLISIAGNTQKLDGGAMYGNAPREVWSKWSLPDAQNRITLACRALLLQTDDGKTILFETGIGNFFEPKLKERFGVVEPEHVLLASLTAVSVKPEDIDAVVLSHLHFDHAGGLLSSYSDGPLHLVFPKAEFYVGKRHWDRAQNPHARDRASFIPTLNQLLKDSGRLVLVDDDGKTDLASGLTFRFSDGHTPGLMLSQIQTAHGPLVFVADLIPGMSWMHLPITMGYDRYPELLVSEKTALLNDLLRQNGRVFFTHDPQTPCAFVKKDANGRFFGEEVRL